MKHSRIGILAAACIGFASVGGDCDGDVVSDPTFRDWCGDKLCAWDIDAGTIQRVATWNAHDFGVSLVDTPTEISQTSREGSAKCLLFTTVADIDVSAQVSLLVDFDADGSIDFTSPIEASNWRRVSAEITAPDSYRDIRFSIRKEGQGRAVLAELRVQSTTNCSAPAPLLHGVDFGERCSSDSECKSGVCPAGDYRTCGQCSDATPCASGGTCKARSVFLPNQCDPGSHLGAPMDPCLADSDCKSGTCAGASFDPLADDAGACDLDQPASQTNCTWYAMRGGQCL